MRTRAAHTVLVVDDDANLLDALRRVYVQEPYNLLLAREVGAARQLLSEYRVDVLVCDHRMPGTSGAEFLAEVRITHPDVISMMLTGYADPDVAVRAVNAGNVYRFFTKPCDPGQLALEIRAVLEQKVMVRHARQLLHDARQTATGEGGTGYCGPGEDRGPVPLELDDAPADLQAFVREIEREAEGLPRQADGASGRGRA